MTYNKLLRYLLVAVCSVILANCSNDIAENDDPQSSAIAIGWDVSDMNETRSEYTTSKVNADGNTFKVWSKVTIDSKSYDVFDGTTVTRTSGAWTYSPKKYWNTTEGATYTFNAVMPSDENSSIDDDGKITISNVPLYAKAETGTDYMVATSSDVTVGQNVALDFKHILAKLVINVKPSENTTNVVTTIKSLVIAMPKGTANYKQGDTDTWTWSQTNSETEDVTLIGNEQETLEHANGTFTFFVAPTESFPLTISYEKTANETTYTKVRTQNISLAQGSSTTVNVTVE